MSESILVSAVAAVRLSSVLHADISKVIIKVVDVVVKRLFSKREFIIGAL
jgi:hypothetical protein